jgi:hypothetical protein
MVVLFEIIYYAILDLDKFILLINYDVESQKKDYFKLDIIKNQVDANIVNEQFRSKLKQFKEVYKCRILSLHQI